MKLLDYSRSFFTFRIDALKKAPVTVSHEPPFTLNNARIQLDCQCEIRSKENDRAEYFFLGVSCKTERVGVERDIWMQPNADYVPILSKDSFMALKTFDHADKGVMLHPRSLGVQPERQTVSVAEAFDSVRFHLAECSGRSLQDKNQIIEAILEGWPLVARTTIESDSYIAVIEYPVKTINANERDGIYQTDTGPILLPDFSGPSEDLISRMELAFSAFNCPDWTEFIVRAKTQLSDGLSVYHYCKPIRLRCRNQIFQICNTPSKERT